MLISFLSKTIIPDFRKITDKCHQSETFKYKSLNRQELYTNIKLFGKYTPETLDLLNNYYILNVTHHTTLFEYLKCFQEFLCYF